MSFFKKLFSFGKESDNNISEQGKIDISGLGSDYKEVISEDYFSKRYKELSEKDESLLTGSIKMVDSFFIEMFLKRPIDNPVNHPKNLDFAASNGYLEFCEKYGFGSFEAATQLAFAFSKYMITNHNMTFYSDSAPEYQYRVFTIKKDINKIIISLYPLEYCLKVISKEKTFEAIVQKIIEQENNLPEVPEILKKYIPEQPR